MKIDIMYNIMKNSEIKTCELSLEDLTSKLLKKRSSNNKIMICGILLAVFLFGMSIFALSNWNMPNLETAEGFSLSALPVAKTAEKMNVISIPTGVVKANPFVPYRNLGDENDVVKKPKLIQDVPKFDLIEPPDTLGENADAMKIMDTVVSGILYDKFSPSAILNINGNDYLVKKGDTVNNYKVLAIAQDSVTVQYGKNTYKAGIGGILTDGKLNYNEVSNINKKFGGEQR